MTEAQKMAYAEAMQQHMAQVAALQQCRGMEDKLGKSNIDLLNHNNGRIIEYPTTLKVPQPGGDHYGIKTEPTFVIPDDGLGYDDGVRVLRALGTW